MLYHMELDLCELMLHYFSVSRFRGVNSSRQAALAKTDFSPDVQAAPREMVYEHCSYLSHVLLSICMLRMPSSLCLPALFRLVRSLFVPSRLHSKHRQNDFMTCIQRQYIYNVS